MVFLVCCPFLVVLGFCWIVVKCFFNFLRDLNTKEAVAKVYTNYESVSLKCVLILTNKESCSILFAFDLLQKQYPLPATVYSTSSDPGQQVWDQPLPIWASSANSMANGSAWDHAHQLEPR